MKEAKQDAAPKAQLALESQYREREEVEGSKKSPSRRLLNGSCQSTEGTEEAYKPRIYILFA